MELWYPKAVKVIPISYIGSLLTRFEKHVLHSTESKNYRQSRSSYYGHQLWPHATPHRDPATGRWIVAQHLPLNRSSACMRNLSGGVETNRDGCIQTEIAWVAAEGQHLPEEALEVLSDWMWFVHQETGIPWKSVDDFHYYVPENGIRLGQEPWRLRGSAWDNFMGILGHQHADENVHGDPGKIDIKKILSMNGQAPPPPEEEEDEEMFAQSCRTMHEVYFGYDPDPTTWTKEMLQSYNYHLWQMTSGQASEEVTRARFEKTLIDLGKL